MYHKLLAILALTATLAHADFVLYTVGENQIIDIGSGFSQDSLMAFELGSSPSCDEVRKARQLLPGPENDASGGGYSCDGCYSPQTDVPIEGWDIKRLEMYNKADYPFFDEVTEAITLYKDRDYELTAKDNTIWGQCDRITERTDDFSCVTLNGALSGVPLFTCYGYLSPVSV